MSLEATSPPPQDQMARVQAVIRAFARKYAFLHEKRIQKLLFAAEYTSLEKTGKPLLGLAFKHYYHGVYSDLAHLALSQATDLPTAPDVTEDNKPTVVFLRPDDAGPELDPEAQAIVDATHQWTRTLSTDELAWFGKSTEAWASSLFDEPVDLLSMSSQPGFATSPEEEERLWRTKREILQGKVRRYPSEDALMQDLGLG